MKHTRIVLFYILALVVSVYARTVQVLYLTEPKTGFFMEGNRELAFLLCGVIALSVIASAVISNFSKRTPKGVPKKSPALTVSGVLLSLSFLYEAALGTALSSLHVFSVLCRVFAAISFFGTLLWVVSLYSSKTVPALKLFWLAPVGFLFFKIFGAFSLYSSLALIADYIFYLFFLCSTLSFFTLLANLENGYQARNSSFKLFPAAVCCSVGAALCFVPQFVLLLLGREPSHLPLSTLPLTLAVFIFSLIYVFGVYKKNNIVRHHRKTHSLKVSETYDDLGDQFLTDGHKK